MKLGAKELKRQTFVYETITRLIQEWSSITLEECRKPNKDNLTILSALQDTWRVSNQEITKIEASSSNPATKTTDFNSVQKSYDIYGNLIGKILRRFGWEIELSELCYPGQLKANLFTKLYTSQIFLQTYEDNDLWTRFKSEFTDEEVFYIFFDSQALTDYFEGNEEAPSSRLIVMLFDGEIKINELNEILSRVEKFLKLPERSTEATYVLLRLLLIQEDNIIFFQELIDMIWTHHRKIL